MPQQEKSGSSLVLSSDQKYLYHQQKTSAEIKLIDFLSRIFSYFDLFRLFHGNRVAGVKLLARPDQNIKMCLENMN